MSSEQIDIYFSVARVSLDTYYAVYTAHQVQAQISLKTAKYFSGELVLVAAQPFSPVPFLLIAILGRDGCKGILSLNPGANLVPLLLTGRILASGYQPKRYTTTSVRFAQAHIGIGAR